MSFNISQINPFVNETAQGLIKKAILTGRTFEFATVVPGIKYKEALNILDNTVTIAAASCGWNPAGSVAFKQRDIEVVGMEVKDALCEKTLEKYWLGQLMTAGSPKSEEVGPILADSYVEKIKAENEHLLWQGNTAGTPSDLMNGFLTVLDLDGNYIPVATAAGPHAANTIVTHVDAMVAKMPEVLYKLGPVMYMSNANFRLYIAAMASANLYHVNPATGVANEWVNPINGVTFRGIDGLTGSDALLITYDANLVIGTDLVNEEEKFDIWYSRDNDEVRVNIQWKLGTQVQFPELTVLNQA